MASDRRAFIKKGLYGLLALLSGGYLFSWLVTLAPRREAEKRLVFFPLLPEDDVPRHGVKKAELVTQLSGGGERKSRVFVVSSAAGMTVFSAVCSHLGCLVNYNKEKKEFLCPCHGGRYDLAGRNIAGPPPRPLTALPVKVEKGIVMVGVKI